MTAAEAWAQADAAAAQVIARKHAAARGPIIVGLAGAQGSGKSTMAPRIAARLGAMGLPTTVLSLDDFYLTRAERAHLARSVHPLLATRGVPGTHDLALLRRTLDAALSGRAIAAPRFDKAADDRLPPEAWAPLAPPCKVIVLEGWCVGARPQPEADLAEPVNALERDEDADGRWRRWVNAQLGADYAAPFGRLALRIFLRAPGFEVVEQWRAEQEAGLPRRRMTDAGLRRFIAHYERITRWMLADQPGDLVIPLDATRTPMF